MSRRFSGQRLTIVERDWLGMAFGSLALIACAVLLYAHINDVSPVVSASTMRHTVGWVFWFALAAGFVLAARYFGLGLIFGERGAIIDREIGTINVWKRNVLFRRRECIKALKGFRSVEVADSGMTAKFGGTIFVVRLVGASKVADVKFFDDEFEAETFRTDLSRWLEISRDEKT